MKKHILLVLPLALIVASCASHQQHSGTHSHVHGANCGHVAVAHDSHTDYLDAGHLHHQHAGHVDDHVVAVSATNPNQCTPGHGAGEQPAGHVHTTNCGHAAVPHGDHTDYLVAGHLHHPHGDHCDNHGALALIGN